MGDEGSSGVERFWYSAIGADGEVKFKSPGLVSAEESMGRGPEAVGHPAHYAGDGSVESMDALRSMMGAEGLDVTPVQAFWWGNAFKYLWRWPLKNGTEDLRKCRQCIDYLLEEVER